MKVNGDKLLEAITSCKLFSIEVINGNMLIVWSSGAAEQLEAMATDCIETE